MKKFIKVLLIIVITVTLTASLTKSNGKIHFASATELNGKLENAKANIESARDYTQDMISQLTKAELVDAKLPEDNIFYGRKDTLITDGTSTATIKNDITPTVDNQTVYDSFSTVTAEKNQAIIDNVEQPKITAEPNIIDNKTNETFEIGNDFSSAITINKQKLDEAQLKDVDNFKELVKANVNNDYGTAPQIIDKEDMIVFSNVKLDKKRLVLHYPSDLRRKELKLSTGDASTNNLSSKATYLDFTVQQYLVGDTSTTNPETLTVNTVAWTPKVYQGDPNEQWGPYTQVDEDGNIIVALPWIS